MTAACPHTKEQCLAPHVCSFFGCKMNTVFPNYARDQRPPSESGCKPLKPLTEEDVRRIVREELAKEPKNE